MRATSLGVVNRYGKKSIHSSFSTAGLRRSQHMRRNATILSHSHRSASSFSWPGKDSTTSPQPKLPVNYGVRVVPQQYAWVVERLGKAKAPIGNRLCVAPSCLPLQVLQAGLHFLIPVVDRIAYVHRYASLCAVTYERCIRS